jgi:hypothetical protein
LFFVGSGGGSSPPSKQTLALLHKTTTKKTKVLANPHRFDVAVTTYEMINSAHFGGALKTSIVWRYLVLDEGHKIKSGTTLVAQGVRQVQRQHTLLLTGTPLQNNLLELHALLAALYPDVFTDPGPFEAAFDLARGQVRAVLLWGALFLCSFFVELWSVDAHRHSPSHAKQTKNLHTTKPKPNNPKKGRRRQAGRRALPPAAVCPAPPQVRGRGQPAPQDRDRDRVPAVRVPDVLVPPVRGAVLVLGFWGGGRQCVCGAL